MNLKWELDTHPESYGDLNLAKNNGAIVGWLSRSVSGEMIWTYYPGEKKHIHILGNIPDEEAMSVVDAMMALEG